MLVLIAPAAWAGNGTFKNGVFNFCVSVRFNANAAQLAQIRTAFQDASQILADATDGQHRFGTISIVNNSGASESAEYWINAGSGRAYATQGEYGVRGQHVNLFFDSDFQARSGAAGDAYTIAHEHAHHAYGVLDEYSGPTGPGGASGNAECATPPDAPTLNYSLMDNYFTRGGRASGGTTYTLNEFCTAGNHDADKNTWQTKVHKTSAWEVIAAHPKRSAEVPATLPVSDPPPAHTVTFREGFAGLRTMLVIDRSGSMLDSDRLTFAKAGANAFINLARTGDAIGIVSFAGDTRVDFPLTTITDASVKTRAQAAVSALAASGSTNIGDGLLRAHGQLTAQTTRSCNEIIVLLTDGDHNTGTSPESAIPQLQDGGVTVFTTGVGTGISTSGQALLQQVARELGGKYFRVANSFSLAGLYLRLFWETTGSGLLTQSPQTVATGQTAEAAALVEVGAERATFALTLANPADTVDFNLRTPSGSLISPSAAIGSSNIEYAGTSNSKTFQIRRPEAGRWQMVLTGTRVTTGSFELLASSEQSGVQISVMAVNDNVTFPNPAEIHATPRFKGEAVLGATVNGSVIRPDGSRSPITLFDDGREENGDGVPNDGNYAARFNGWAGNGTYTFEITVSNVSGSTHSGEELFSAAPGNRKPVTAFTRTANTTAVLSSAPQCSFGLNPALESLESGAGTSGTFVETLPGCSWNAASNVPWIVFNSGASGTGSGWLYLSYEANPSSSARTGTVTVSGETFTLKQAGVDPDPPTGPSFQPSLRRNLTPGFYIAEATLVAGEPGGFWGLEAITSLGQAAGGFNLGGALHARATHPGFGAFLLTEPQTVTATLNSQVSSGTALTMRFLDSNRQVIAGPVTGSPPLSQGRALTPGFYIVEVTNPASTPFTYQLGLAADFFAGGVNTGGYVGKGITGFGAFYVPETQDVTVSLYGRSTYGSSGAGDLILTLRDANRQMLERIASCATFPESFTPFSRVYSVTAANRAGDRLVVGQISLANFQTIRDLPLPNAPNQKFCDRILPGGGQAAVPVYVPTAAERSGDFSPFAGLLIDPLTAQPFPNGIIPASRLGSIFAFRTRTAP